MGLTDAGFVPDTLEDILEAIKADLRSAFGESINLDAESNFGKLAGVFANYYAQANETMEEVYQAFTPDGATGNALIELGGLTGTVPLGASYSVGTVTLSGTPGTIVLLGRVVSVDGTGARFQTLADVTIGGGGTTTVPVQALLTGPTVARAGTLTHIETPVSGWTGVTNAEDIIEGSYAETAAKFRLRREKELRAQGAGALPAITAAVQLVDAVTEVVGFENTTDTTDGDGMAPHSVEIIVDGGGDSDIRDAIFASKDAGIATNGTTSGTVADVRGNAHVINFSRPEYVDAWVSLDIEVFRGKYPANGDTLVAEAVADWGDAHLEIGSDVVPSQLVSAVFAAVPGIKAVNVVRVGDAELSVSTSPIVLSLRSKADLDSSRVIVNATVVTTA